MKTEVKVAWPKASVDASTAIKHSIQKGEAIQFSAVRHAVGTESGMVIFSDGRRVLARKEDYVIFQYGILLRAKNGKVAVFDRARYDHGQERITYGRSLLLGASDSRSPFDAVPSLLHDKLSLGCRHPIEKVRPIGVAWNELPKRGKEEQPVYMLALYEVEMPDCRLNGMVQDYPDSFVNWVAPKDLRGQMGGYIDNLLVDQMTGGKYSDEERNSGRLFFSSRSRIAQDTRAVDQFDLHEFQAARTVFVSHASKDSFTAFALFSLLRERSNGEVFPIADLNDISEGEMLDAKVEAMLNRSDCVVVLVTEHTGAAKGVKKEIAYAQTHGIPLLGFWLSADTLPEYLSSRWVTRRPCYPDWLREVDDIVDQIRRQAYRGEQQGVGIRRPLRGRRNPHPER